MKVSHHRRQAGDTIVEVLIAIGVVSLVLAGAFGVSTRSSKATLDSQEHAQAQQFLQAQVEQFRSYVQTKDSSGLPAIGSSAFCMISGSVLVSPVNASCNQEPVTGAAIYRLSASRGVDNLYTFAVDWDSVTGITAKESFVYKVYPGL